MRKKKEQGLHYGEHATWPWRVIGDGRTVEKALACARDYEHHDDVCSHCGRTEGEEGWRVYPIDVEAWELLTCGGAYEEALQPRGDFPWCHKRERFVTVIEAVCVACRGEGDRPDGLHCDQCEGCGTLDVQGADRVWLPPPDSACVWRGDS